MNKKILILEDNKDLAQMYAKLLKSNGYDPTVAFDGIEGLEKLQEMEPDLIIMDVSMPRMSGVGFYQQICGLDGKPKYPILVATGRTDLETTFKNLPVDGLILKPFERADLLKEIGLILNKKSASTKSPSCLIKI